MFVICLVLETTEANTSAVEYEDDIKDLLLWLQNCSEPFHEVEEKWRKTEKYRLETWSVTDTIANYFSKFPALKKPLGYILVRIFTYF